MAAPQNLAWDPKGSTLIAVGLDISGFAGDDMLELVPDDPMVTKTEVGPQGDTVRVASANRLHRITFTLMSAHPLNRVLYALAETREPGPFLLQSLSDGRRAAGAVSYVEATPDSVKQGKTHNGLKWVIAIPQCKVT